MYLEMHIGDRLIDRVPVDFTGIETIGQRENYLTRLVNQLETLHKRKIVAMHQMPTFFIEGVQSKMNKAAVFSLAQKSKGKTTNSHE